MWVCDLVSIFLPVHEDDVDFLSFVLQFERFQPVVKPFSPDPSDEYEKDVEIFVWNFFEFFSN